MVLKFIWHFFYQKYRLTGEDGVEPDVSQSANNHGTVHQGS